MAIPFTGAGEAEHIIDREHAVETGRSSNIDQGIATSQRERPISRRLDVGVTTESRAWRTTTVEK
jgi:hypothetical protein